MGKLCKSGDVSLNSIDRIRFSEKHIKGSTIHSILPCRQTMQNKCKSEFNISENYEKLESGYKLKKEKIDSVFNVPQIYLWADGAVASKKSSLLVLIGKDTHCMDCKNKNKIIFCLKCEKDWRVVYVGFISEKKLELILPKIWNDVKKIENLASVKVVADNACLNVLKNIKNNNNTRCSFCKKIFISIWPNAIVSKSVRIGVIHQNVLVKYFIKIGSVGVVKLVIVIVNQRRNHTNLERNTL
jgi:hypothetical protein